MHWMHFLIRYQAYRSLVRTRKDVLIIRLQSRAQRPEYTDESSAYKLAARDPDNRIVDRLPLGRTQRRIVSE